MGSQFLSEQGGGEPVIFACRYTPPTVSDDQPAHVPRPSRSLGRLLLTIGVIVAVIGGGIWVWEEVLEDRLIPKRFGVVVPGSIYRSGQLSPTLILTTEPM